MIWFVCKQCGSRDSRPDEQAGTLVFCTCGQGNRVPWESEAEIPAPEPVPAQPGPPRRPFAEEEREPPRSLPSRRRLSEWGEARPREQGFCFNHQETAADRSCDACGETFCDACVVTLNGRRLCGPCKNFEVRNLLRPGHESGAAIVALIVGLVLAAGTYLGSIILMGVRDGSTSGMLFGSTLGLVLSLVPTLLGWKALLDMNREPRLRGRSLAVLGLVAGLASLLGCAGMLITSILHLAME